MCDIAFTCYWVVVSECEGGRRRWGTYQVLWQVGGRREGWGWGGLLVVMEKEAVIYHEWTHFQIWVRLDCGAARVGYNYIKIHFRYGLCGSVG